MRKILSYLQTLSLFAWHPARCEKAKDSIPASIYIGTFNTLSTSQKVTVNPAISGDVGTFYFENRYNYESVNSASINIGKNVFGKSKNIRIVPMIGVVIGSYKAINTEVESSFFVGKWIISIDNELNMVYNKGNKSQFFNWSLVRYKITKNFHLGITNVMQKVWGQRVVFDKGITFAMIFLKGSFRFYSYNWQVEKRYYWLGVSYPLTFTIHK